MSPRLGLSREARPAPEARATAPRALPGSLPQPAPGLPGPRITPQTLLSLQRSVGNAAAVRALAGQGLISTAQAAASLRQERESRPGHPRGAGAPVRFRLPTGADVQSMLTAGDLPEDKLKRAITLALERMAAEGRITLSDPVPDVVDKLFPGGGKFDETLFKTIVDVTDRSLIYQAVADAETTVSSTDKPNLQAVMDDAVARIDDSILDDTGLEEVFGKSKVDKAKKVYRKAKARIADLKADMDARVETDYNRDDEEVGLGGWASFGSQRVHLERQVAEVADKDAATITIVHEACHLAKDSVDDHGYYGSTGFEAMSARKKVNNAAHYEELPRRQLGMSLFPGLTFTPGKTHTGGAMTFEDEVLRDASEYVRKAWDKAVDVHAFLRDIRKDIEGGSTRSFRRKKKRILEISRLEHLTIHEQQPEPTTVNLIDVVLSEGVAHALNLIDVETQRSSLPAAAARGKRHKDYVAEVVAGAVQAHGSITGNDADDKALLAWLVKKYRKAI